MLNILIRPICYKFINYIIMKIQIHHNLFYIDFVQYIYCYIFARNSKKNCYLRIVIIMINYTAKSNFN